MWICLLKQTNNILLLLYSSSVINLRLLLSSSSPSSFVWYDHYSTTTLLHLGSNNLRCLPSRLCDIYLGITILTCCSILYIFMIQPTLSQSRTRLTRMMIDWLIDGWFIHSFNHRRLLIFCCRHVGMYRDLYICLLHNHINHRSRTE